MPLPLPRLIAPAWFDEARLIVQGEQFRAAMAECPLAGQVLNAGCGEGLYAPLLEEAVGVAGIWNVDLARPSVARRRADGRHHDIQASLTALPFPDRSFDAAICSEVIEHIRSDETAVRELARVLRPGGVLYVSVPAVPAPYDPAHVREGYTRETLVHLLRSAGFEILSTRDCHHALMRLVYRSWHWQRRAAGRNLFPRFVLRAAAHADRITRWGRAWDLIAVARRAAV
jgi:ubiquinone/menaquinone biosynthesis C-methylase UbiE